MRIGIDGRPAYWYRGTGIGTYTYQLISSLNKVDKKNDYLIFNPEFSNSPLKLNNNFNIKNINAHSPKNFWNEVNIPAILKNNSMDIYHVPQNGVGLPKNKNCKFIITLHDVIPYRMPETVSDRYLKIFSEEIPKIVSSADGIITVSDFSKKDIMKSFNYPEDKIFVTHLASEDIYMPLNKEFCRNILKMKYNINKNFILYVGGFSPRKNILGLIDAFYNLINIYKKDISLVIVGRKGKIYEKYIERVRELNMEDKVFFPGFISVKDLPYFYNCAEIFVYPSFYEGFGLPPIEAMACGTPVITSNVTSIPEITKDAAMLINPYDTDSICKAMYTALSNENMKTILIKRGLNRTSQLTWNNCAKSTLLAYKKILCSN
ncbi:glycosyltransferase family 4 protein [Clostridium botulinum]|uniref:glycosyltransferase family 4 protein n=1 Tax=Clostridium botulinum TaxID=1491 RepID=UPI003DA584D1